MLCFSGNLSFSYRSHLNLRKVVILLVQLLINSTLNMLSKKLTALVVFVFVLSFTVSSAGVSEKVQDVPLEYDEVLEDDYRLIQAVS